MLREGQPRAGEGRIDHARVCGVRGGVVCVGKARQGVARKHGRISWCLPPSRSLGFASLEPSASRCPPRFGHSLTAVRGLRERTNAEDLSTQATATKYSRIRGRMPGTWGGLGRPGWFGEARRAFTRSLSSFVLNQEQAHIVSYTRFDATKRARTTASTGASAHKSETGPELISGTLDHRVPSFAMLEFRHDSGFGFSIVSNRATSASSCVGSCRRGCRDLVLTCPEDRIGDSLFIRRRM
jgi:hypothetical protein